jgi:hypothetical protein
MKKITLLLTLSTAFAFGIIHLQDNKETQNTDALKAYNIGDMRILEIYPSLKGTP